MRTKLILICIFISCLAGSGTVSGELDLGSPVSHTPYDVYLEPVWKVFHELGTNQPDRAIVEQLVREGRGFRYVFKSAQPYVPQTPEETEASKSGDCKAKSLWLASKMNCRKLRFVIGKFSLGAAQSHAWLIWEAPDGWLVLDATNFSKPLAPDHISPTELVPTYSYSPSGKFIHSVGGAARGAKYGDHL